MAVEINVKGPIISNSQKWLYDWMKMEACAPKDITDKLNEANGEDIVLNINSNGGAAVAGFEIYTLLKSYEGKVIARIVGAAMSAASIIACAADECLISDAAIFMIHNTRCYAEGDYRDMEQEADALKQYNEAIINVYEKRTGKTREELQELMDNNTYMSPKRAIELGFVDDYMFKESEPNNQSGLFVVNSEAPVISEAVAQKLQRAVLLMEDKGKSTESQKGDGDLSITNKNGKEGNTKMTLEEFLKENPTEQAAVDRMVNEAKESGIEEGAKNERTRLQELDAISKTVTSEALNEAKYGEKRTDAKTLAYECLMDDSKRAEAYMKNATQDADESGAAGVPAQAEDEDVTEAEKQAERLASVANKRGGMKS